MHLMWNATIDNADRDCEPETWPYGPPPGFVANYAPPKEPIGSFFYTPTHTTHGAQHDRNVQPEQRNAQ